MCPFLCVCVLYIAKISWSVLYIVLVFHSAVPKISQGI